MIAASAFESLAEMFMRMDAERPRLPRSVNDVFVWAAIDGEPGRVGRMRASALDEDKQERVRQKLAEEAETFRRHREFTRQWRAMDYAERAIARTELLMRHRREIIRAAREAAYRAACRKAREERQAARQALDLERRRRRYLKHHRTESRVIDMGGARDVWRIWTPEAQAAEFGQ